ncbi:MAG TPA: fibronectin type III domain-containing protein [Steroidobacteraceae bacterium]|nr:fibronectin type III domain-containing protein [Steroidobacteraceae bacterium]
MKKLSALGASIALLVLAGCIDPGPDHSANGTPVAVPRSHTATLSWEAPTSNTNGTPLTDLAGYRIYYGSSPGLLTRTIAIPTEGLQTYVIDDLEPGTWYFAVMAVASNGSESSLSDIVLKTIT